MSELPPADDPQSLSELLAELQATAEQLGSQLGDLGRLGRQSAVAQAEQSVIDARADESGARPPLQDARAELARIETEARTLAKILNAASGDLFPSVLAQISV